MIYKYRGINKVSGERVSGSISALSSRDSAKKLEEQSIEPISIELDDSHKKKYRKVKPEDLVLPLQELATLLNSGIGIAESLSAQTTKTDSPALAFEFQLILKDIESGEAFSAAIKNSSLPFPDYFYNLVQAGEMNGELGKSIAMASEQLNYDQEIKGELRSALVYPVLLVTSGVIALIIIFMAVVPKFVHLLDGSRELPFLANAVLSAGKTFNESPILVVSSLAALFVFGIAVLSRQDVRFKLLNKSINLPVVGPWLNEQEVARWSYLSSSLLLTKVDLINALRLASDSCRYHSRKLRAEKMIEEIRSGTSFVEAIRRAKLIPESSLNLISVGDKTGQLGEMLAAVAQLHDKSCKRKMKQVLTLVEPISIIIVGILLGFMIMGIVQAISVSTDITI